MTYMECNSQMIILCLWTCQGGRQTSMSTVILGDTPAHAMFDWFDPILRTTTS